MKIKGTKQLPSMEEYALTTEQEEEAIHNLLRTKDGEALIRRLTAKYDGSLVAKLEGRGVDGKQTLINIGAREVVHYLRELRDREKKA
jgi:hypothetical protein